MRLRYFPLIAALAAVGPFSLARPASAADPDGQSAGGQPGSDMLEQQELDRFSEEWKTKYKHNSRVVGEVTKGLKEKAIGKVPDRDITEKLVPYFSTEEVLVEKLVEMARQRGVTMHRRGAHKVIAGLGGELTGGRGPGGNRRIPGWAKDPESRRKYFEEHGLPVWRIQNLPEYAAFATAVRNVAATNILGDVVKAADPTVRNVLNSSGGGQPGGGTQPPKPPKPPNDPGEIIDSGDEKAENGDTSGAISDYSDAISLDPKNSEALAKRGGLLYNTGDYPGALSDARAALAIDPSNESAKGTAKFAEGRMGPDMAAPKPGNPFESPDGAAQQIFGRTAGLQGLSGGDGSEAALLARQAMQRLQMRDYAAARNLLDRAISLNPANAEAHATRAWLTAGQGRVSDAIADLKTLLKVSPKQAPGVITRIAGALNKQGRYQDAKSLLDLLRPQDRDASSWFTLAAAENGLGNRDAMMASLKRAAELDPRYAQKLEAAMRAGLEDDLGYLFDQPFAAKKGKPAAGGEGKNRSLLWLILAMVAGGCLVAFGLMHVAGSKFTQRWAVGEEPDVDGGGGAVAEAPVAEEPRATRIGNVELVRQIGLGGMGIVYEGLDTALHRRVAVKKMREEIRIDPRERERFIREARTVANLRHGNIVEIHSILEDGDDIYLVFEYVDGGTVYELLDRRGKLPLKEAARVAEQAGEALAYAHEQGIIHRDLKPSNIMLSEGGAVKVMDFGVARQAKDAVSKLSMTNTVVGTPPYMAPEQEQGMVCKESDVYALAICFYEMLTGRLPFQGIGAGILLNKMNKSYAPASTLAPELPAALDSFFAKAFEPDPARRYRTVPELLTALRGVAAGRGASS